MTRSEMDMIRDILGWSVPDERKLGLIRQIVGERPAPKPTAAPARKAAAKAPAKSPKPLKPPKPPKPPRISAEDPGRVVKRRRRSLIRGEGSAYTRRSQLWAELKRLAPEKLEGLSYTKVSNEQLEPLVEEARKAR
ncbi:MAG TPA: hypothetical protein VM223_06280 [Planctomycetota bacterium]|nr:hypothetical protein [Planctomycetota bacterium]